MKSMLTRFGLRFSENDAEERFRIDYCVRLQKQVQIVLVLGGLIYYIFFVWDRMIDPIHIDLTHSIRSVLTLVCFGIAGSLFWRATDPYIEEIQVAVITLASSGLAVIYTVLDRGFEYGGVGIVIVILFSVALLRMRFLYYVSCLMATWAAFIGAQLATGHNNLWLLVVNNLTVGSSVLIGLFAVFNREIDARREFILKGELQSSRQHIEDLILSMLPAKIVARMNAGEKRIADSYGEVSIVFADLVQFSQLARKVAPHHLVEILNKLFSRFDELAMLHRVEKIKTIGDAYMAVCGMEKDDSQHAERAAEFAFGMLRSVQELAEEIGIDLNVRIGLHVGPVIAGVIGTRRPAFDCWGDSVNIASRLESSGVSGGIQISETARWRLQKKYKVEEIGDVDIKGIGVTKTYAIFHRSVSSIKSTATVLAI